MHVLLHRLGLDYRRPEAVPRGLDAAKQQAFIDAYDMSRHEHRRALEAPRAQIVERPVGFVERVRRGRRTHFCARREGQELFAVGAGQIGDRGDAALLPQQALGERGDVAHVNAA